MSRILEALATQARQHPRALALEGAHQSLDYAGLWQAVQDLAAQLQALRPRVVALWADNGPAWAIADLAALAAGIPCLPLPTYFTPAQCVHALRDAGADLLLVDGARDCNLLRGSSLGLGDAHPLMGGLRAHALALPAVTLPAGTCKITYTSGSTGAPKGVCLGHAALDAVAASLCEVSLASREDRHVAVLPLATLLENIAGLYAPILAGAVSCLLPGEMLGLRGSSDFDPLGLLAVLSTRRATTAVLVPQMLQAMVAALRAGAQVPHTLRFIALGGAVVSPRLLAAAAALSLPVFEGYGLSECASVVALNRPGDARAGCVGRPLPHVQLRIDGNGGIYIRGAAFLGYLGEPEGMRDDWVDSGDIGHLDAAGRLYVTGRRKHQFVTAFGRNVAPEWVEGELSLHAAIAHAVVVGEGRPFNVAVLHPRGAVDDAQLAAAVANANRELPDYARVLRWVRARQAFSVANGLLTANGRPRRSAVVAAHAADIANCYTREHHGLLY